MAFSRFEKRKQQVSSEKKETPTEPFVVSVNPYVSVRRALNLVARISSAQVSSRLRENSNEIIDILQKHDFFRFMDENRGHLLDFDLRNHFESEVFDMLVALDNESFGNVPRVKAVVAGGFNAGKSSFLNYVVGRKILPEAGVPATAVPAYLFCQKEAKSVCVFGENRSGAIVSLDEDILLHISHTDGADTAHQIATSLKRFIVEIPHSNYQSLMFIDAPGFGSLDSNNKVSTDDAVANSQLMSADFMVYLVQSPHGGVMIDDWERIDAFGERPVLLILTKNDLQTEDAAKDVFNATVSSAKKHPNVKGIVSMSVYDTGCFLSTCGKTLPDILNGFAKGISTGTEIDRCWRRVETLLKNEIEASQNTIEELSNKFKVAKESQNEVNKTNITKKDQIKDFIDLIRETLVDDINKSNLKVQALDKNLRDFFDKMLQTHKRFVKYYEDKILPADTLLAIINGMDSDLCSIYEEFKKSDSLPYGFYSDDNRMSFVKSIEAMASTYQEVLDKQYDDLNEVCVNLQHRMSEEKKFISLFTSIRNDLDIWLGRKVGKLVHIPYTVQQTPEVPNIFEAIMEMDAENLILALSKPTDLTTSYNEEGYSPLTYAASCGNIAALRMMLSLEFKGEYVPESVKDQKDRTMMECATQKGQDGVIRFLNKHYHSK